MSMPRKIFDPHAVLGLSPTATQDEITHPYRKQVRAHYPDTGTTPHSIRSPMSNYGRCSRALLHAPQATSASRPRSQAQPHRAMGTGGNDKHQ